MEERVEKTKTEDQQEKLSLKKASPHNSPQKIRKKRYNRKRKQVAREQRLPREETPLQPQALQTTKNQKRRVSMFREKSEAAEVSASPSLSSNLNQSPTLMRTPSPLADLPGAPRIIERSQHSVSRRNIDQDALRIMYRLIKYGYRTFLVGGAVRDLLLGVTPKDYDLVTEAKPEEVRRMFRNSRIIGRRFRLVHIFFKDNRIFETSTFRKNSAQTMALPSQTTEEFSKSSKKLKEDNDYGNPETDAWRRDLTINGLFYDPNTKEIIDYVHGFEDLEKKVIKIIGNPDERFIEDPVRMLRVVRHAAKTKFKIEKETYKAVCRNAVRIALCPQARIFEEFLREMKHGASVESFKHLFETGLLAYLFPALHTALLDNKELVKKLEFTLKQMSLLAKAGQDLSQSVLFASLVIGILLGDPKADETFEGKIGLHQVWAESPLKAYYEHDFKVPAKLPDIDVREYLDQIKSGYLRSTVQSMFRVLGVSKRECEILEKILIIRFLMFEIYYGVNQNYGLEQRKFFKPALSLLQLTARDKYAKDCLKYWLGKVNEK
ncbi:MAG: polynucleotide adenylyltransferase PcnB [Deltaproteobacteria bacterium]|nr:polynucleotide adenylyltransferase PcnB [Deltaproteobacteria bacterium]